MYIYICVLKTQIWFQTYQNLGSKIFRGPDTHHPIRGTLIGTKKYVLDKTKVYLTSTEQIYKNKQASFAFICTFKDIVKAFGGTWMEPEWARSCFIHPESKAYTLEQDESKSLSIPKIIQKLTDSTFFPTKYTVRAKAARQLHEIIGHPNDFVLCKSLDNANLLGTHLTSVEAKYAKIIIGQCIACQQGKMKAPSAPTSMSQPPLHVDIYPTPTSIVDDYVLMINVITTIFHQESFYITLIHAVLVEK